MSVKIVCDRCKVSADQDDETVKQQWAQLTDSRNNSICPLDLCGNCTKAFDRLIQNAVIAQQKASS